MPIFIHFQSLNGSGGMTITSLPVPSESVSLSQEFSDNFLRFSCVALTLFGSVLRLNLPVLVSGEFFLMFKGSALVSGVARVRRCHRLTTSRLRGCSNFDSSGPRSSCEYTAYSHSGLERVSSESGDEWLDWAEI
jgi:hypothetical protein